MNMHSEWAGTAALLRHYDEVRTRLRTPSNAVPDTGINLRNGRPEQKTQSEPPPKPRILPCQYKEKVKGYLHSYRTSFCRKDKDITIRTVVNLVARELGVSRAAVMSGKRTRVLSFARQVSIYLTAKHTTYSIGSMATYLDIDRTTALYSRDTLANIMAKGGCKAEKIYDIETKLLATYPGAALSPFHKQPVAVEPGAGPQVPAVYPVDS